MAYYKDMKITKKSEFSSFSPGKNQSEINPDDLAEKIGKVVAREMKEVLKEVLANLPKNSYTYSSEQRPNIEIDDMDKVIPVSLQTGKIEKNLKNMAKEEKTADKNLSKSKNKLKDFMKKGRKK